jgi:hypothetical protein
MSLTIRELPVGNSISRNARSIQIHEKLNSTTSIRPAIYFFGLENLINCFYESPELEYTLHLLLYG